MKKVTINGVERKKHKLNIFPEMEKDSMEFRGIVEDIKTNGYDKSKPITLYEDAILKGWHRAIACEVASKELGVEIFPEIEIFVGTDKEAWESLKKDDLYRRQMKSHEIAMALVANKEFYNTISESVKDIEIDVENDTKYAKQNANKTDAKIAKETGTNPETLRKARKLKKENPEKFKEVMKRNITFAEATKKEKPETNDLISKTLENIINQIKKTATIPKGMEYGRVVNYAVEIIERELSFLKTWDEPKNNCHACEGTGRSKDGKTKCPQCENGLQGERPEDFLEWKSQHLV